MESITSIARYLQETLLNPFRFRDCNPTIIEFINSGIVDDLDDAIPDPLKIQRPTFKLVDDNNRFSDDIRIVRGNPLAIPLTLDAQNFRRIFQEKNYQQNDIRELTLPYYNFYLGPVLDDTNVSGKTKNQSFNCSKGSDSRWNCTCWVSNKYDYESIQEIPGQPLPGAG